MPVIYLLYAEKPRSSLKLKMVNLVVHYQIMNTEEYTDKIDRFIEIGNFHAAVNVAISGMNAGRKVNDQVCIDKFLGIIDNISKTMAKEFGSKGYLKRRSFVPQDDKLKAESLLEAHRDNK